MFIFMDLNQIFFLVTGAVIQVRAFIGYISQLTIMLTPAPA